MRDYTLYVYKYEIGIFEAKLLAQVCCVISVPLQTSYTPTKATSTPPNISDNRLKSHCIPALEKAN